ncbi:PQQ-binding-like beta-propeller repeat protein [Streptomyces sp. NPDC058045]|uniref:outer membrane protein assembly factor BamB family protein n=1 Tax=Streptomyces sp. NPDC058045 TaxID=3346311 RepID=UPI0036E9ADB5
MVRWCGAARAGAVAVCAVLLAGCGGGGTGSPGASESPSGGHSKPNKPAEPTQLKPLWRVPTGAAGMDTDLERVWTARGTFVVQTSHGGLSGYDARTGKPRWKVRMPEGTDGICTLSQQPNAEGIGAVVFARTTQSPTKGTRKECTTAGAVDITGGKVLWTERSPLSAAVRERGTGQMRAVSVGASVVSLTYWDTGVLHRFGARTGKRLKSLGSSASSIADTFHNGVHIGVADEGRKSFTLYEAETAKRLWSSPPGTELRRIVTSDPLALEVRTGGEVSLRTYGKDGTVLRTVVRGKEIHTSEAGFEGDRHPAKHGNTLLRGTITPQFVAGGVLLTHFEDGGGTHYAYDLHGGREAWQLTDNDVEFFAAGPDRLLASATAEGARPRLLSVSPSTGEQRTLATLAPPEQAGHPRPFAGDGERIYVARGATVEAYRLPHTGTP